MGDVVEDVLAYLVRVTGCDSKLWFLRRHDRAEVVNEAAAGTIAEMDRGPVNWKIVALRHAYKAAKPYCRDYRREAPFPDGQEAPVYDDPEQILESAHEHAIQFLFPKSTAQKTADASLAACSAAWVRMAPRSSLEIVQAHREIIVDRDSFLWRGRIPPLIEPRHRLDPPRWGLALRRHRYGRVTVHPDAGPIPTWEPHRTTPAHVVLADGERTRSIITTTSKSTKGRPVTRAEHRRLVREQRAAKRADAIALRRHIAIALLVDRAAFNDRVKRLVIKSLAAASMSEAA